MFLLFWDFLTIDIITGISSLKWTSIVACFAASALYSGVCCARVYDSVYGRPLRMCICKILCEMADLHEVTEICVLRIDGAPIQQVFV